MNADTPRCRGCGAPLTTTLVDLGRTPLANSYVSPDDAARPEKLYPLRVRVCAACLLAQAEEVVPAADIFSSYAYLSSMSDSFLAHAEAFAADAAARFGLSQTSNVVEIGSNDGYLLQYFVRLGIGALGVEPAANVAEIAHAKCVPTENAFFGLATARRLRSAGKAADLLVANNVIAHVPDINDFVAGAAHILGTKGVWTIEFPHLLQLVAEVQFDTIYHEHYSYLSLLALRMLLGRHGLRIFDVEELPTHGGSLRIYACHAVAERANAASIARIVAAETSAGFDRPAGYLGFEPRVRRVREGFLDFLEDVRLGGAMMAAYGAAAKGNTFLNYCGVTSGEIPFVADRNPLKQGKLLPGSRIPIVSPAEIFEKRPDYVLILPWNLRDEVKSLLRGIGDWGGRFVTAVPELEVFAP